MRFRKLRIAWSVLCGIACVLLIVLWVRSYWWWDTVQGPLLDGVQFSAGSHHGRLAIGTDAFEIAQSTELGATKCAIVLRNSRYFKQDYSIGFAFFHSDGSWAIHIPHWFAIDGLAHSSRPHPWLRWRFSLRTLLIATTLVAVVLGLIVWMSRAG